jgi:hypothetical protein
MLHKTRISHFYQSILHIAKIIQNMLGRAPNNITIVYPLIEIARFGISCFVRQAISYFKTTETTQL